MVIENGMSLLALEKKTKNKKTLISVLKLPISVYFDIVHFEFKLNGTMETPHNTLLV